MEDALSVAFANPSSVHQAGRASARILSDTRSSLANAVGCRASEVILMAGGTEAVNAGILGLPGASVISTSVEHPALSRATVERKQGMICMPLSASFLRDLEEALMSMPAPALIALQWVNHEVGLIFPIQGVARLAAKYGARVMVDASQALGRVPIDLEEVAVDAVAFASHKVGGPAGAAALFVRRGVPFVSRTFGGGQERGRRAGSLDPIAQAGFGAACRQVPARLAGMESIAKKRDRLEQALVELGARVNLAPFPRVATVTNVSVAGWRGDILVAALDVEGLCVASGAACSSGVAEPSRVVLAMHDEDLREERAATALRLSLGPETTDAEIDEAIVILRRVLARDRPADRSSESSG